MFEGFVSFVRDLYGSRDFIPLHEPRFIGNEKQYLLKTIDSTFVSSVGEYVDLFEELIKKYTGLQYAVATVNGTSALHIALLLAGVGKEDEVITQSLTFVATCNAIRYCNASPIFVDVERSTLGLSPESLESFLSEYAEVRDDGICWNKITNRPIRACVPMHTFGHPVRVEEIDKLCKQYCIALIEDAAESLGSFYKNKHTGITGKLAAISFNGNKIITSGGGGMLLTNDKELARKAKHITTTAKSPHKWEFVHDQTGYNYRLPNLNAALGVAQMEMLPGFVEKKRHIAKLYQSWGSENGFNVFAEPNNACSNYWLNTIITENLEQRNAMLEYTNANKVMTRCAWKPMHQLQMNTNGFSFNCSNTEWLAERIINVPSSVLNG